MAEGDTLVNATKTVTGYVDALIAQKRDLRVALTWAIMILRQVGGEPYPYLMDALELRSSKFEDYEDLKIYFNEKDKEHQQAGPFGAIRRMIEGGE
jgi:hypothetical protein